jgi:hypothetical protein
MFQENNTPATAAMPVSKTSVMLIRPPPGEVDAKGRDPFEIDDVGTVSGLGTWR